MKKEVSEIKVQEHILPDGSASEELKQFLRKMLTEMKANAPDYKQPPWKAFPSYSKGSMGWKMGPGEDYWIAFHEWIYSLDGTQLNEFVLAHPEPKDWKGFYNKFDLQK